MATWKKSSLVFKEAASLTAKAWPPVLWLIIGQLVLTYTMYYYTANLVDPSAPLSDAANSLWRLLGFALITLYQVFWTVALIRLLKQKNRYEPGYIFGTGLWRQFPSALVLLLIVGLAVTLANFLFVIPGILLGVWWGFAIFILILEDQSVMNSLKGSYELVKGWWWAVFSRVLFLISLAVLISALALIPVVGMFLSYVLYMLFVPVVIVYMGLTYQELRSIKTATPRAKWKATAGRIALLVLWAIVAITLLSAVTALAEFFMDIMFNSTSL